MEEHPGCVNLIKSPASRSDVRKLVFSEAVSSQGGVVFAKATDQAKLWLSTDPVLLSSAGS